MKIKVKMPVLASIVILITGFSIYGFSQGREDRIGEIFKIDGKPDSSYKLDTPADAVYAFIDLIKSGDFKKTSKSYGWRSCS